VTPSVQQEPPRRPAPSLGGSRHTRDAMRRWFERLFRLFPDARFELRAVAVDGWPWNCDLMRHSAGMYSHDKSVRPRADEIVIGPGGAA
jgi:hypothetical protein